MNSAGIASDMSARAGEAAALMKALSNEHRLLILCHLISEGEMPVGALLARVGLSQSALSQHLAKLREQRLVDFRRESQSLLYRVSDPRAEPLLELLRDIFCPELGNAPARGPSPFVAADRGADDQINGVQS